MDTHSKHNTAPDGFRWWLRPVVRRATDLPGGVRPPTAHGDGDGQAASHGEGQSDGSGGTVDGADKGRNLPDAASDQRSANAPSDLSRGVGTEGVVPGTDTSGASGGD